MRFFLSTAVTVLGAASLVSAASTRFRSRDLLRGRGDASQLPDGMPNPSPEQLREIELHAQGTLPNGPPPPTISHDGITNLQLIAFNEIFEVVYFNELRSNVTNNVEGYQFEDPDEREFVIRALNAIVAVWIPPSPPFFHEKNTQADLINSKRSSMPWMRTMASRILVPSPLNRAPIRFLFRTFILP